MEHIRLRIRAREAFGIISVSDIFGEGIWLADMQAHFRPNPIRMGDHALFSIRADVLRRIPRR
jgi:hypothetical protein